MDIEDVDTLISLCRDEKTKLFFAEAIACYKAGALRAAIVATWIAVVFDFIAKFRELELTGDKNAALFLTELERIYVEKDAQKAIHLAQEFERTILDRAKNQFELLSSHHYRYLSRLYEDRHRCAHPSMHSLEEPYQPTKELVRSHLRNAVTCLLQQPPVQGKAAEERIWADIHSEYFPSTIQEAQNHFAHGPLARAKESLLRSVIVGLTKDLLKTLRTPPERDRQYAALGAALLLSYQKDGTVLQGNDILKAEFPSIVLSVVDEAWPPVISYLHRIPSSWDALGDPARSKAYRFIQSCSSEIAERVITEALDIPALQEIASERLSDFSLDSIAILVAQSKHPEYIIEAIRRWGEAESFEEAKIRTKTLIIPLLPAANGTHTVQIVSSFEANRQLYNSFLARDMLLDLFKHSRQYAKETEHVWVQLYNQSCRVIGGKLVSQQMPSLLSLIEDAYPWAIDSITAQARKEHIQQQVHDTTTWDEDFDTQ